MQLCRQIASQLVDEQNARSKGTIRNTSSRTDRFHHLAGASMFFKRVRRAPTWEVRPQSAAEPSAPLTDNEETLRERLKLAILSRDDSHMLSTQPLRNERTRDVTFVCLHCRQSDGSARPRCLAANIARARPARHGKCPGRRHTCNCFIPCPQHDAVPANVCTRLVAELQSPDASPRAAALFQARKVKAAQWGTFT